ncbi:response regulator [Halanaerobacter jeridensis]|uniref:Stage 0 sporulation protein A homolog n=1 Tax=Halanaerobacter jeridensis TaxID=706427 RepID=A0A939BR80_9FIRM|nr:DNA-binding NarL/FixJ family response regulator/copper chaperone CopZ [Halanaerobacter jeridensis]
MADFLVIDDSLMMRKNIKSILESLGQKVVGELETGAGVVDKYEECQPDIISLDLVMPQVDGLEALKKIKNEYPQSKVIIITCLGEKSKILEALNLGADYYIVKPIEIKELVEALNNILDEEDISERIAEQIENPCGFKCSREASWRKKKKEDAKNRLKEELENLEKTDKRNNNNLEEQLDDIASELDEGNNKKPFKVINESGNLKVKINKVIDEDMIKSINETIKDLLVIESLKISFDLRDIDFAFPKIEEDFEKIINKIEVVGGEVEIISS